MPNFNINTILFNTYNTKTVSYFLDKHAAIAMPVNNTQSTGNPVSFPILRFQRVCCIKCLLYIKYEIHNTVCPTNTPPK